MNELTIFVQYYLASPLGRQSAGIVEKVRGAAAERFELECLKRSAQGFTPNMKRLMGKVADAATLRGVHFTGAEKEELSIVLRGPHALDGAFCTQYLADGLVDFLSGCPREGLQRCCVLSFHVPLAAARMCSTTDLINCICTFAFPPPAVVAAIKLQQNGSKIHGNRSTATGQRATSEAGEAPGRVSPPPRPVELASSTKKRQRDSIVGHRSRRNRADSPQTDQNSTNGEKTAVAGVKPVSPAPAEKVLFPRVQRCECHSVDDVAEMLQTKFHIDFRNLASEAPELADVPIWAMKVMLFHTTWASRPFLEHYRRPVTKATTAFELLQWYWWDEIGRFVPQGYSRKPKRQRVQAILDANIKAKNGL